MVEFFGDRGELKITVEAEPLDEATFETLVGAMKQRGALNPEHG